MATQKGMSGIDLHAIIGEFRTFLPLWVGKIYQYDPKTLGVRLNGEKGARHNLIIETGRRTHLTDSLPEAPPNPSGYSMFLRKYLLGGRILAINQYGMQRIIEFQIGKKDATFHLVFELFDEGNIILCDENFTIIKPLWHHRFRDREVVPGVPYVFPGEADLYSLKRFAEVFEQSNRDVVRTLAVDLMLGGVYAEEVCREAGIDKADPASADDAVIMHEAFIRLLARIDHAPEPVITSSGCWPVSLGSETVIDRFPTFNEALDAFYPRTIREMKTERPRLSRDEIIRKQQLEAIAQFEKKISQLERKIETIYSHYSVVAEAIETLSRASRDIPWQDIEHILKKSDLPAAQRIIAIHPAESAVELALDVPVKIYVRENIEANVGRYYEQLKKFKKKREGAQAAMKRPIAKSPKKKVTEFRREKPRWYHKFRWMHTSDGVLVIGGRDAAQNEELVKRYMEGGDAFIHADVHGGSVVLVKGETDHMDEVAQFAASYSNAWKSGFFSADVYVARPDQVSKTPESGEYVARGAFIVRGERTYLRNVPLRIAIGIRFEPIAGVIGGSVSAVRHHARVWIELQPGTFEPNDIAKKVLRLLRERLSEDERKGLMRVLNTESVAAFVPSGGSDIVHHEG